jgi:hypothetical protein
VSVNTDTSENVSELMLQSTLRSLSSSVRTTVCTYVGRVKVVSHVSVTCQFRISDVSVPYQYRPFGGPAMCEWFYLKYMRRCFCAGHRTDGTDTGLTRH